MPLFRPKERQTVESLACLTYSNPFDSEFVERQRTILGSDYVPPGAVWSLRAEAQTGDSSLNELGAMSERLARDTRERLLKGRSATTRWYHPATATTGIHHLRAAGRTRENPIVEPAGPALRDGRKREVGPRRRGTGKPGGTAGTSLVPAE